MRTFPTLAFIPVAVLLLASCGDGSSKATNSKPASVTAEGTPTTVVTDPTVAGPTAPALTTPETVIDGPVQIDVVVGVDSGPDRIVRVKVGADVTLNITNRNADDAFHVHGIDLEQAAPAGTMATLNFKVDQAGTFEVESHITGDVLLVIQSS